MRVAVTGAAGFIGSHLVDSLLNEGHEVAGLDSFDDFYSEERKRRNLAEALGGAGFELLEGDVRDAQAVHAAIAGADAVVHLAARAGVRPSFDNPGVYTESNVVGLASLLAGMAELEVPRLVFISSSSVYGEGAESPFREDGDTGVPKSPYAATKVAGEAMCLAYSAQIPRIAALRLFSVYGPRQRPDLAIQKFAQCIQAGEPIPILGSTDSFRDYTYVDDIVSGIKASLNLDSPWVVLNLGNGRPIKLEEMITRLEQVLGRPAERELLPPHPGDLFGTWADVTEAERVLSYRPQWAFEDGVQRFAEWFQQETQLQGRSPTPS